MSRRAEEVISEEEAIAIWRRAARLQMEAAHRLEERSRSLLTGPEEVVGRSGGIRQAELEAAAVEAGISAEYVQLAQAIMRDSASAAVPLAGWEDRAAVRFLGTRERSIEVARMIAATPKEVVTAMQRILPAYPYFMALKDSLGGRPEEGGVLVFSLPPYNMSSFVSVPIAYHAAAVDLKQLLVRIIPSADGETTEVVLVGDMHVGMRRNWRFGAVTSGVLGAFGGGIGAALGTGLLAAGAVVALPATVGVALFTAVGARGYGAVYRYYRRKFIADLEELLQRVDVDARTGGSFQPPSQPPRTLPGSGGPAMGTGY